mgnify:CR=1 FL=1
MQDVDRATHANNTNAKKEQAIAQPDVMDIFNVKDVEKATLALQESANKRDHSASTIVRRPTNARIAIRFVVQDNVHRLTQPVPKAALSMRIVTAAKVRTQSARTQAAKKNVSKKHQAA